MNAAVIFHLSERDAPLAARRDLKLFLLSSRALVSARPGLLTGRQGQKEDERGRGRLAARDGPSLLSGRESV